MTILDDIKGLVGEFRAGLAELAQQDRARIAEMQELRGTVARQAATLDEQRAIIARLTAELEKERTDHGRTIDERDAFHDRIDEIADALGDETDWTSCNDRGARALELAAARPGHLDITELRAEIERRYEVAPEAMQQLLDQLYAAIDRAKPASPEIAELGKERMRRHTVEQHVRTLLGILDATGGYMPSDYQAAIRAAREAVSGG